MKKLLLVFVWLFLNLNLNGQIMPIEIEFDSIRPLTELNSIDTSESFPWISNDGLRLYCTKGVGVENKIVFSERNLVTDLFSKPEPLSILEDSESYISQWLSDDELNIFYFSREVDEFHTTFLYHATRSNKNEEFNSPIRVELLGGVTGYSIGPSLTNDLQQLFIYNDNNIGEQNLILEKSGDYEYTLTDSLEFPEGFIAVPGLLSHDALKYYFGLRFEIDLSAAIYYAERESVEEKFDSYFFIDNDQINDSLSLNFHAMSSKNGEFLVFTRNNTGNWNGNDLYMAYNFKPVAVTDYKSTQNKLIKTSPNPASEFVNFNLENFDCLASTIQIAIFLADGRLVEDEFLTKTNSRISLSTLNYNAGLYFYKLFCDEGFLGTGSFVIENGHR